jgi:hypothetical protein
MRRLPALLAVSATLLFVACGSGPTGPSPDAASAPPSRAPSVFPDPTDAPIVTQEPFALVTIEIRGGECPSGLCTRLINIEGDRRLHEVIPKDKVLGTVPEDVFDALKIEVEQANYQQIESKPFRGECPTAVDGQETIYTFHVTTGDEEIASCKVAIDQNHPLFQATAAAIAAAGGL